MKKLLFTLFLGLFTSCVSLTTTQIESVNQYATSVKNFSAYPSKIITGLADIREKRCICYANSLSDPKLHIDELDSIYSNKIHAYKVSKQVDITFEIIDKYAQSLSLLSSDDIQTNIDKESKSFGVSLDSLVGTYNKIDKSKNLPTDVGSAVSQLIALGGKQYVKNKQAKEIREFVLKADTLISTMTTNLLIFLKSENIDQLIHAEEWGIHENYLSFLHKVGKPSIENEYIYLDLKAKIDEVKTLRTQTIKATEQIRSAHKELLLCIQRKKDLKEILKDVQSLSEQIKDIKKTIINN
jgi:hypothetical protein